MRFFNTFMLSFLWAHSSLAQTWFAVECTALSFPSADSEIRYTFSGYGHPVPHLPEVRVFLDPETTRLSVALRQGTGELDARISNARLLKIDQDRFSETYALVRGIERIFIYFDRTEATMRIRHWLPVGWIIESKIVNCTLESTDRNP